MTLHPMLVHFPVALLTVYAALEIVRLPVLMRARWWFPTKAVFVVLGVVSSIAAYVTGLLLRGETPSPILVMHQRFAVITIVCFGVLALAHIGSIFCNTEFAKRFSPQLVETKRKICATILRPWIAVPLAIVGLGAITVTGALGGSMVYGPDVDPVARIIYDLLLGR